MVWDLINSVEGLIYELEGELNHIFHQLKAACETESAISFDYWLEELKNTLKEKCEEANNL